MTRMASESEQAACLDLGRRLMAELEPFARSLDTLSDDEMIATAGAMALGALALALEDRTPVARASLIRGVAIALGSMEADINQTQRGASILPFLLKNISVGIESRRCAMQPMGRA